MSDTIYDESYDESPTSQPDPIQVDQDLLIEDLSYQDAKDYVMRFLIAEKKLERQLHDKQRELEKWNERLAVAEKNNTPQQLEDVKRHLHRLIQERDTLAAERDTLHRKNVVLKEKLQHMAHNAGAAASARAEKLLSDFEQLVDVDEYKLQEAMKDQEADEELAKLKAKLNQS
ncbi:hypothetical protein GF339_20320 [candidate division KSB3 bacterium]|uniref:Uncharacterized protein n=1 Tax=candidate division KSB3 bacterium TaxID=2044937 RepID=A0A9D5JZ50_9BACT|nr:hypothetical protein [candidate division KSB3 bacterium]MBD3326942.1 hypothetical protein [candidate division KSB3 bacterium]